MDSSDKTPPVAKPDDIFVCQAVEVEEYYRPLLAALSNFSSAIYTLDDDKYIDVGAHFNDDLKVIDGAIGPNSVPYNRIPGSRAALLAADERRKVVVAHIISMRNACQTALETCQHYRDRSPLLIERCRQHLAERSLCWTCDRDIQHALMPIENLSKDKTRLICPNTSMIVTYQFEGNVDSGKQPIRSTRYIEYLPNAPGVNVIDKGDGRLVVEHISRLAAYIIALQNGVPIYGVCAGQGRDADSPNNVAFAGLVSYCTYENTRNDEPINAEESSPVDSCTTPAEGIV